MYELAVEDKIWNRACDGGGECPSTGDSALAALLKFHGTAMNGGVLHATECLSPEALTAAQSAYGYFGFGVIAKLIDTAEEALGQDQDVDSVEDCLDQEYHAAIPDDATLVSAFEKHFKSSSDQYALLVSPDLKVP
jgi:hypothetical protein